MEETQESTFKPFTPGAVKLSTAEQANVELPNGKILPVHIEEVGEEDFNDGTGPRIAVRFVIDEGEFKGQNFKKWFSFKASPKAGFTQVALAALGDLPAELDPSAVTGKPLQVIFQPDTYNGKTYKKATYLPPAEGQTAPAKDVVPTLDDVQADLDKAFDAALEQAK